LVFPGLENYPKSHIHVYTRSGQLVYQSDDYQNDWDGRTLRNALTSHELVPVGVYYYILELVGASRTVKGFIYIGY
jgi:gliding motility-associated-like protein